MRMGGFLAMEKKKNKKKKKKKKWGFLQMGLFGNMVSVILF